MQHFGLTLTLAQLLIGLLDRRLAQPRRPAQLLKLLPQLISLLVEELTVTRCSRSYDGMDLTVPLLEQVDVALNLLNKLGLGNEKSE